MFKLRGILFIGVALILAAISTERVFDDLIARHEVLAAAQSPIYAKFQPDLYEQVLKMRAHDTVTVAFWIVDPGYFEREAAAQAQIASQYPEAQAALDAGGGILDVSDPRLAEEIESAYRALIFAGVDALAAPLIRDLDALGYTPQHSSGLPAVSVTLTKNDLLAVTARADVGTVYLTEGQSGCAALSCPTLLRLPKLPSPRSPKFA